MEKMPVDFETLNGTNQLAVTIFSRLPSKYLGEVGYVGKDYSSLEFLCKVYGVTNYEFLLDLLSVMDAHHINKASKAREKTLKKAKTNGR